MDFPLDLVTLKQAALAADADWESITPTIALRTYHELFNPSVTLRLLAHLERQKGTLERLSGQARKDSRKSLIDELRETQEGRDMLNKAEFDIAYENVEYLTNRVKELENILSGEWTKSLVLVDDYLAYPLDRCTCGGAEYGHEQGCGLEPILDLKQVSGWKKQDKEKNA